jgi:hypothetical protein
MTGNLAKQADEKRPPVQAGGRRGKKRKIRCVPRLTYAAIARSPFSRVICAPTALSFFSIIS